ncbi:MAG: peptidoglycan-associated lipoprotein Pal [Gammaproteobacteria bacterium]|nr:peptidoglycan-associated lipoprotein Pal [Gammaproteobacteria bacterium]MDH5344290.1 peptidoglycan-associated lipoprotein Pal [Gammaproteobacteria bacterium]
MKIHALVVLGLAAIALGGCGKQNIPDPDPQSDGTMVDSGDDMSGSGFGEGGLGAGEEFDDFGEMDDELTMVIYFDFDQSELRAEYADLLQRHASRLSSDRRASVRLEGHADERGSREYNIGLGERRAQAVRRLLMIQGAGAEQISTVSFGEERPAAFGSDEESYQLNRRVELKYAN